MDLLERYLGAIARNLPDAQKADITAELRDVLLSQVEEEESRLGRPLTEVEQEAVHIRFGHPLTVSGRYRQVQYLIGPEMFPFWWAGLKLALIVVAGVYLALVAPQLLAGVSGEVAAPAFEVALMVAFAAVTLVCAVIERFGKTAILTRWKPRNLPPPHGATRSAFDLVVEISVGVLFIFWWTGVVRMRDVFPQPELQLAMAPVWAEWFWPILAYGVLALVVDVIALVRPSRVVLVQALLLMRSFIAAGILSGVYLAGRWVEVTHPAWTPAVQAETEARFNLGMRIGIAWTIAAFMAFAGLSLWRLWQATRPSQPTVARSR